MTRASVYFDSQAMRDYRLAALTAEQRDGWRWLVQTVGEDHREGIDLISGTYAYAKRDGADVTGWERDGAEFGDAYRRFRALVGVLVDVRLAVVGGDGPGTVWLDGICDLWDWQDEPVAEPVAGPPPRRWWRRVTRLPAKGTP